MSIFSRMSYLSKKYNAINLGQGFPAASLTPQFLKDFAVRAITNDKNQYTSSNGEPHYRQAIASSYSSHFERKLDWETEIATFSGAQEAISCFIDSRKSRKNCRIVCFEPFYESYKKFASHKTQDFAILIFQKTN